MKVMEEREKAMEKKQKKWGIPIILEQLRCEMVAEEILKWSCGKKFIKDKDGKQKLHY
jgi:hypothetical protein